MLLGSKSAVYSKWNNYKEAKQCVWGSTLNGIISTLNVIILSKVKVGLTW